jgi:hypothetical protein
MIQLGITVTIMTRIWAGQQGFDSQQGQEIFLLATTSRIVLGPSQPPIQWVLGAISLGVKWMGNETDHSPPSNAEVKKEWHYSSTPPDIFMACCFISTRDNLTFTKN